MTTRTLVVLPLLMLVGVAGCGDDDVSQADFITDADQTCKELTTSKRGLESAVERGTGDLKRRPNEINATAYPRQMIPVAAAMQELASERVSRFRQLELPSKKADRARARAYVESLAQVRKQADELKTLIPEQQRVIAPAAVEMRRLGAKQARANRRDPGLRPATEEEAEDNHRLSEATDVTQTALNRITEKLNDVFETEQKATGKAAGYGMRTCGKRGLISSAF